MSAIRYYKTVKEVREWYLVEYYPLRDSSQLLARLNIIVSIEDANKNNIIHTMEEELKKWLDKYPIPLHVYAFDNTGALYDSVDGLIGFLDSEGKASLYWRSETKDEIPCPVLNQHDLDNLYSNLEYTTDVEHNSNQEKKIEQIILGHNILFVIIPATILLTGFLFTSIQYFKNTYSELFSLIGYLSALWLTATGLIKILGGWPKSEKTREKEKKKEKEEAMKKHYYYYCELNPEGFNRLKLEVDEKQAKNEIAKEIAALKNANPKN